MATFTAIDFDAGTIIDSSDMNENFTRLENLLNGGLGVDNVGATGFGSAAHGDLSAVTSNFHNATSVVITDSGDKYTSTTVEGALAEIASGFDSVNSSLGAISTTVGSLGTIVSGLKSLNLLGRAYTVGGTMSSLQLYATTTSTSAPSGIIMFTTTMISLSCCPAQTFDMNITINGAAMTTGGIGVNPYRISSVLNVSVGGGHTENCGLTAIYLTADGWDPNIDNLISWTGSCTGTIVYSSLIIFGLSGL